jgi:hypothetical protein
MVVEHVPVEAGGDLLDVLADDRQRGMHDLSRLVSEPHRAGDGCVPFLAVDPAAR